jgi:NAD kinase
MAGRIVLVTRQTRLQELIHRFNTREQARFYIQHMGLDFGDYEAEHETYARAIEEVVKNIRGLDDRSERIERSFLPTFLFRADDVILAVGQDGLVVNIAKYLSGQPIVAVNPDAARWSGVLLPFHPGNARAGVARALDGHAATYAITMAEATLNDGQRLLAVNDFLIGCRTHVSARYRLRYGDKSEEQSSSGVLVSTGAGSTGWLSSTRNMTAAVSGLLLNRAPDIPGIRLAWDDPRLVYVVREPYESRSTGVSLCAGYIPAGAALRLESHMAESGVIFSDGVEADALAFNAGAVVTVQAAKRRTRLVASDLPGRS